MTTSIPQAVVRDYPGGYAKWHADMEREANRHPVKSPVLDGVKRKDAPCIGLDRKNAASGQKSGKTALVRGEPNQTERCYRDEFLIPRILSGEIVECIFEGKTFELAHRCTYTPDWYVVRADGDVECHEVKGSHVWDDARVKLKVAARLNPEVKFVLARWWKQTWKISVVPK